MILILLICFLYIVVLLQLETCSADAEAEKSNAIASIEIKVICPDGSGPSMDPRTGLPKLCKTEKPVLNDCPNGLLCRDTNITGISICCPPPKRNSAISYSLMLSRLAPQCPSRLAPYFLPGSFYPYVCSGASTKLCPRRYRCIQSFNVANASVCCRALGEEIKTKISTPISIDPWINTTTAAPAVDQDTECPNGQRPFINDFTTTILNCKETGQPSTCPPEHICTEMTTGQLACCQL